MKESERTDEEGRGRKRDCVCLSELGLWILVWMRGHLSASFIDFEAAFFAVRGQYPLCAGGQRCMRAVRAVLATRGDR